MTVLLVLYLAGMPLFAGLEFLSWWEIRHSDPRPRSVAFLVVLLATMVWPAVFLVGCHQAKRKFQ